MLTDLQLDWDKVDGLMPAIIQDYVTGRVLMLGYMNQEALEITLESQKVTFYSRTRQRLWTKGESSGNFLNLQNITYDCDHDSLLVLVEPVGPTCHLQTTSCFAAIKPKVTFLAELEQILASKKNADPSISYTAQLFKAGTKRIAQKVGEEGVETALAATVNDTDELTNEAADLIYHLLVLLLDQNLSLADVVTQLENRHQ